MRTTAATNTTSDTARDRSIRLFRFLYEVERFRATRVHNLAGYGNTTPPGGVLWLGNLPNAPELRTVLHGTLGHDSDTLLEVDRPDPPAPPVVPPGLAGRIESPQSSDLGDPPTLRPGSQSPGGADEALFQDWLAQWKTWAEEMERLRPVRELYRQVFRLHEQIDQHPEDLEAVVAAGCLSWHPDAHVSVQRHLAVMTADVVFDAESGRICLQVDPARQCDLELDMLDPSKHPRKNLMRDVEEQLTDLTTSVLDLEAISGSLRSITHALSDEASFDADALMPRTIASRAHVAFAPALVVRKRTNERKLRVLQDIIAALEDDQQPVPDGVASIVAPIDLDEGEPQLDPDTDLDNAESYLPLVANRAQQEIVWSVEHRRHTVVQGPPGTGKTHTIANVLSHLLATGRRVLITAHTERALKEVRGKLPEPLRDLVIAVTGQGRDEKTALERSVRRMTTFVDAYQPVQERKRIEELEAGLDDLRRKQARIRTELVQARVRDVETTTIGVYHGTPAQIAKQLSDHAGLYGWLADAAAPPDPPLDLSQRERLLELLRRADLTERTGELDQSLPAIDDLPTPDELSQLVYAAQRAEAEAVKAEPHQDHPAHATLAALDPDGRRTIERELRAVADDIRLLQTRPEPWIEDLLQDLSAGKPGVWEHKAEDLDTTLAACAKYVEASGSSTVRVSASVDRDRLFAQAEGLKRHLAEGGSVRKVFSAKAVRDASELLEHVVVDGATPDTLNRVETFIAHTRLDRGLERADAIWSASGTSPANGSARARLAWHRAELDVLVDTLARGKRLTDLQRQLTQSRTPHADWTDPHDITILADVAAEPDLQQAKEAAQRPLIELATHASDGSGSARQRLRDAVVQRDVTAYRQIYQHIRELLDLRDERAERDRLLGELRDVLPATAALLHDDPDDSTWQQRLAQLGDACAWAWARGQLHHRLKVDPTDELMHQLDDVTHRLREQVLDLTVARSWTHAIERLDVLQRRRLNTYALLSKRLPRGGQYRARKLREVQDALRLCRDAVPAWIMPINYVADVLDVDPNAFDVVIVDEASQAGMDATFLQYLAPKMIVIGDDLQVSPTAFVDRSELHRLADDLLSDFEDKALWSNPENSLFDHASNRFGKRITLTEHFRCMPEIIGFSQRFIYEDNGVQLIPLRQYGAQRLTPILTHHVPDGYRTGKVNRPEIEAVVELVAKCAADPSYEVRDQDGTIRKHTFGVISLTGSDQAKLIDQALVEQLGEQEYAERDVRCGDAADFQGSQREVIFLSLVEAVPEDGSRIRKRGDKATDQRINVAASRAQDQMWLIHSVLPEQLHPEDIRHKLLTYSLSTARQFGSQQHAVPQPADEQILDRNRFDSLFEQHVFNRIVDRGYAVQPQVSVSGYRIDLVVTGSGSRLAVECDGDEYHGPDQYAADIARQRDLERAGWTFFRVRGSRFYANRQEALEPLWDLLNAHGINPVTHQPEENAAEQIDQPIITSQARFAPESDDDPESVNARPVSQATPPVPDAAAHSPRHPGNVLEDRRSDEPPQPKRHARLPERPQLPEHPGQLRLDAEASPPATSEVTSSEREAVTTERSYESDAPSPTEKSLTDLAAIYRTPESYRHWDTSIRLPDPVNARPSERQRALRRIIETEGPILGERLYHLYVRSSGGTKVGSAIRRKLDNATLQMERDGVIVADDPLNEGGQIPKTYRMPEQPVFVIRELGQRTLHEVPPFELAARIRALRQTGDSEDGMFRRVLAAYDRTMLTSKARARLQACAALLDGLD